MIQPTLEDFRLFDDMDEHRWKIVGAIAFRREWAQAGKCFVCNGWNTENACVGHFQILGGFWHYPVCEVCISKFEAFLK